MIAFLLMHGLETVIAKNNKGKGKAGPLDAIVLSSDDDYMPVRKLPPAKRRREILPASSLGSDAMPITVDSDEDVKPVFNASPSFKRQKQTTLNKYRSAVKPRDSDGDIVEAITETTAPRFEALGTPQQDVKPNQAALQQQPSKNRVSQVTLVLPISSTMLREISGLQQCRSRICLRHGMDLVSGQGTSKWHTAEIRSFQYRLRKLGAGYRQRLR